jgi:hypothetical protein
MDRSRAKTTLFWALYGLVLIVGLEGFARFVLSRPTLVRSLYAPGEAWWRHQWLERHRQTGVEVYYTFDQFDATKGWIGRPNLRGFPAFGNKSVSTNSLGLRGTREYRVERPPRTRRVLVLGDSFTFGDDVSDDETYSHYLQTLLPDQEIMNFGVHGYGHDQMLILLKEIGLGYQPDVVLLGFVRHDMERNILGFRDYAKPRYRESAGTLLPPRDTLPSPDVLLARRRFRPRLFDLCELLADKIRAQWSHRDAEMAALTVLLLQEIERVSRGSGAEPIFAYLPAGRDLVQPGPELEAGEAFLDEACRKIRVRCFSTRLPLLALREQGVPVATGPFLHWTPEAHRAAADAIKIHLAAPSADAPPSRPSSRGT